MPVSVICQKIQMIPKKYVTPIAYSNELNRSNFENDVLHKISKRSKDKEEWFVISDRNDNHTYTEKSEDVSKIKKTLSFGDHLYVLEDHENWLKLAKKSSDNFFDYGWIRKEKVLLWRRGLLDEQTNINLKGFILNHLQDIKLDKLQFAELYDGPDSRNAIGTLPLHDFYFIYKIYFSKNGTPKRYLLSKNQIISSRKTNKLLGWVESSKITEWNTRLCLEPNFELSAFDERKENKKFQIHAYDDPKKAEKISTGEFNRHFKSPVWYGDPSYHNEGVAIHSKINPRRFNGNQIRFPILNNFSNYYESGILAEIESLKKGDRGIRVKIPEEAKEYYSKKAKNVNLLVLMEGSNEEMSKHVQAVEKMINKIKENELYETVDISIGVYKDILEKKEQDILKFLAPTSNSEEISTFFKSIYWGQNGDYEELTCWKFALFHGIKQSNFDPKETNVVVQVSNFADLSLDEFRVEETPSTYLIKKEQIRNLFSDFEINWIVSNISNDDTYYSNEFDFEIRNFINDFTKEIYFDHEDKIRNLMSEDFNIDEIISFKPPYTPKLGDRLEIATQNFNITKNYFKRASQNEFLTVADLGKYLNSRIDSIYLFNDESYKEIHSDDYISMSNIKFSPFAFNVLRKIAQDKQNGKLSRQRLLDMVDRVEGTRFFHYAYFPKMQPEQNYEPFSLVLFMPEDDLKYYIRQLDDLQRNMDLSADKVRESLQEYFQQLGQQFSGSFSKVNEMEMEDVLNLMIGIEKEGYEGFTKRKAISGCKVKDITNSKKCKDKSLIKFADSVVEAYDKLENILKSKPPYEFKYSTDGDNTYYWIPVEFMY